MEPAPGLPRIRLIWADAIYTGKLTAWAATLKMRIQIVSKRNPRAFEVLPRRWVVERTFAWISKHRRTVRDYKRLPAAVDHDIDAGDVRVIVGGEEQGDVRDLLRLPESPQERPVEHLTCPAVPVVELRLLAPLSITPGEIELTRTPCTLPSIASWRVIPRIAALFVVCASEAMFLKLSCP